jgi:hypothetical protein
VINIFSILFCPKAEKLVIKSNKVNRLFLIRAVGFKIVNICQIYTIPTCKKRDNTPLLRKNKEHRISYFTYSRIPSK